MGRLKLKKKVKVLMILTCIILMLLAGSIFMGIKTYKRKQYEKTYEYKLLNIGYNIDDVNTLLKNFKEKDIDYILENGKDNIYLTLFNEKYFIYDKLYEYINYQKEKPNLSIRDIIERVNTKTNTNYYTNTTNTDTTKNELMLVNKYYYLSDSYVPDNLVTISQTYSWGEKGSQKVTKETYDAFINMWNAAKENDFYLMVSSSYRTYEYQDKVYKQYEMQKGTDYADKIAARPGHSEHQTGLSLDIFERTNSNQNNFKDSECYNWLKDNAHNYGFIVRYPADKEDITGYTFEAWHYRYVGIEAATYIYNNNITFDEYYAYFVK